MTTSFSTQDLRAKNRDYKRDADNHHKWEHGESSGPGRLSTAHGRPAKSQLAAFREPRADKQTSLNRVKANRKRDLHLDTVEATDSSADEEVESSAAPEPDADIAYSFDSPRGPSHGSQVLGHALAQAVERFETKTTEKLVKDEYLVLDSDGEPVPTKIHKKAGKAPIPAHDEEDDEYEIL